MHVARRGGQSTWLDQGRTKTLQDAKVLKVSQTETAVMPYMVLFILFFFVMLLATCILVV